MTRRPPYFSLHHRPGIRLPWSVVRNSTLETVASFGTEDRARDVMDSLERDLIQYIARRRANTGLPRRASD